MFRRSVLHNSLVAIFLRGDLFVDLHTRTMRAIDECGTRERQCRLSSYILEMPTWSTLPPPPPPTINRPSSPEIIVSNLIFKWSHCGECSRPVPSSSSVLAAIPLVCQEIICDLCTSLVYNLFELKAVCECDLDD